MARRRGQLLSYDQALTRPRQNYRPYFLSYDYATFWPRVPFTPTRTVTFNSEATFNAALSGWADGDLIKVAAGAGVVTVTGETAININAATKVVIDFGHPSDADHTKFTGVSAGTNLPAIWLQNSKNLWMYGGEVTNGGNAGILVNGGNLIGTDSVTWHNFYIHDTGGCGLSLLPTYTGSGPGSPSITNCDFKGEVTRWGQDTTWDPHAELGTGLHGGILADVQVACTFTGIKIALYAHDGPTGAGIEIGQDIGVSTIDNITMYLKGVNLTKVATTQTGGNTLNLWGAVAPTNIKFKYMEGTNLQGSGISISGGTSFAGVTIEWAKLTNTNQNPHEGSIPWPTTNGVVYQYVTPKP